MHGQAMRRVCEKLEQRQCKLSQMRALEFFAREGDWQTTAYANRVKTLEAWEIDPSFEPGLRKNLPGAVVRIGDSFEMAQDKRFWGQFDFVVIDNSMGVYGESGEFCEHFEALEYVINLLDERGIVLFNVNRQPFDFEKQPEWQKHRQEFYGVPDTSSPSWEFLLTFYKEFFFARGLETTFSFLEKRKGVKKSDYLAYFVFGLRKVCQGSGCT